MIHSSAHDCQNAAFWLLLFHDVRAGGSMRSNAVLSITWRSVAISWLNESKIFLMALSFVTRKSICCLIAVKSINMSAEFFIRLLLWTFIFFCNKLASSSELKRAMPNLEPINPFLDGWSVPVIAPFVGIILIYPSLISLQTHYLVAGEARLTSSVCTCVIARWICLLSTAFRILRSSIWSHMWSKALLSSITCSKGRVAKEICH